MDPTDHVRSTLRRCVSRAAVAAVLAAPVFQGAACGGKVVIDGFEDGGDGGGGAGGGLSTGASPTGGITVSAGAGCGLLSSGATTGSGVVQKQVTECFSPPSASKCPSQLAATQYILPSTPCSVVESVDCGPIEQGGQCCYIVTEEVVGCGG